MFTSHYFKIFRCLNIFKILSNRLHVLAVSLLTLSFSAYGNVAIATFTTTLISCVSGIIEDESTSSTTNVAIPNITSGNVATALDEKTGAGQVIYTATSDDSTVTYALSGVDGNLFSIDAITGEVTLIDNPNFEIKSSYSFTVVATNTSNNSSMISVTLQINDKTAPSITSANVATALDENSGAGQVIYTATSDDSSVTYSLSGGDGSLFSIDVITGEVTLIDNPNFELQSSYSFTVVATDASSNSSMIMVTLQINNKTAPNITSANVATALDEKSGAGQVIYTATSDDSTVTFSISGTDGSLFSIDAITGEVTLIDNPNFEIQSSYSFTVVATDSSNNSSMIIVTLQVNDKTAPNIISANVATALDEKTGAGQVVYTATSDDNSAIYSLSDNDSGAFLIDAVTGQVTLVDDPDFDTQSNYSFTVVATDNAGNDSFIVVTLAINNIDSLAEFTLNSIEASDGDIKQAVLAWGSAVKDVGQNITYAICEFDNTQINDCNELASVDNSLTATVKFDSLISVLSTTEYFILASSNGEFKATTNELNLSTDEITKMIGYFKASNTNENDNFGGSTKRLGNSIALSGDGHTLAVGASAEDSELIGITTDDSEKTTTDNDSEHDSGAVYLFSNNSGKWLQTAYVKASNQDSEDYFGLNLALNDDGTTLAVGAYIEDNGASGVTSGEVLTDTGSRHNSGAVYLFSKSDVDNSWTQSNFIKAAIPGNGDEFGYSLALNGDATILAVGAYQEDSNATGVTNGSESSDMSGATGSGAVYLFSKNETDSTWSQSTYIKASNTGAGDHFGRSLTLSHDGKTLAVGAWFEDTGAINSGAVYVFNESGGIWSESQFIKASNAGAQDQFGRSLSLNDDGSVLAVGAYLEDNNATGIITNESNTITDMGSATDSGAVYIFNNNGSVWSQTAYIKASNTGGDGTRLEDLDTNVDIDGDAFGYHVALSGDGNHLAVGSYLESNSAVGVITDNSEVSGDVSYSEFAGAVYLFNNDGNTWSQKAYIKASNTSAGDKFGSSVAISNDGSTLVIGAGDEANGVSGIITNGSEITGTGFEGVATNSGAVYVY